MKKGPITPKGFRDINPELAIKRRKLINTIADVLEEFGFVPLETPTLEFAETLLGKYGEEEKLIYKFTDRGGRELAMRYDLTVPLARYIANNLNLLSPTFARYQVGQVFRGEKPQRGRFREFTQFDFDILGSANLEEDAKIVAATIKAARKIGLTRACMAINDRIFFEGLPIEVIRAWDKYDKIGLEGIKKELVEKGINSTNADAYIDKLQTSPKPVTYDKMALILNNEWGLVEDVDFYFDRTLARGLDYYTGTILELKLAPDSKDLSIGGGGRYDKLIGMFAGKEIPAVGISFGIDRLLELT